MTRSPSMRTAAGLVLTLLASLIFAGCSSTPAKPKPTPLEVIKPQIAGRIVWSKKLDGVQFPLAPAVTAANGGSFTLAGTDGRVVALAVDNGRELWSGNVGAKITAGVGSDGRYAAVVTRDNELVTLDAGKVLWRSTLASRVDTPPLVAGERVFVMGVDRVVRAFDAQDGRKLWTLERPGDALTLAKSSVVAAFKDTLIVGQGARMTGVDPLKGTVRWEVPVATPRGTNEVERLADLIGPVARVGDTVCARAFQSAVGCVDAEKGALVWSKNVGGSDGVAGDAQFVFAADASDRITAWKTPNGDVAWTQEKLLYRGLSGPLSTGKTVVFGDSEGYVHFLSRADGSTLLRLFTDDSAVVGSPVLSGTTLLVVTAKGGVYAMRPE